MCMLCFAMRSLSCWWLRGSSIGGGWHKNMRHMRMDVKHTPNYVYRMKWNRNHSMTQRTITNDIDCVADAKLSQIFVCCRRTRETQNAVWNILKAGRPFAWIYYQICCSGIFFFFFLLGRRWEWWCFFSIQQDLCLLSNLVGQLLFNYNLKKITFRNKQTIWSILIIVSVRDALASTKSAA